MPRLRWLSLALLVACTGAPNNVEVQLAPAVISSLDGSTVVTALVAADTTPLEDVAVRMTVEYVDRNGTPREIAPVDGTTDHRGIFTSTITGLSWDGVGEVTVTHDEASTGTATFSVLDRTPPVIEILSPTVDNHVGPGLPLDVQVHVTDEIGISSITLDATGRIDGGRTTVVASGTQDTTLTFRLDVDPDAPAGQTITLYALASDLSGNLQAAQPLELIVDPAISIATPPALSGSVLAEGTTSQLVDPTSIVASVKDGKLYVTDNANRGACTPSCVWRIDAATGAIDAAPVYVGIGTLEGIAVDATADHLYVSDRQDRVVQLAWNPATNSYGTPATCSDVDQSRPSDPYHLVVDALSILVAEGNDKQVQSLALPCTTASTGQGVTARETFDEPRGIALGAAGELYVSDIGTDRVSRVDRSTGTVTTFDAAQDRPYGLEWLGASTTPYADSLMIAASGDRIVVASKGTTSLATAYLRLPPIDLTISAGTMFVVTEPTGTVPHGRIYKVTGF